MINKTDVITSIYEFFNANPVFNLISLLLGLLGILLSFYFYFKSIKNRIPIYVIRTINLVKEKIQKIDTVKIMYSNREINNLSISKIAIWNDGKETINKNDVANSSPIKININNNFNILDAEILYQKNNANDFKIEIEDNKKCINLTFDYFDFEEGVILQIYHTGNSSEDLNLSGTIKSVKKIIRKEISIGMFPSIINNLIKKERRIKIKKMTKLKMLGWFTILMGFYVIVSFLFIPDESKKIVAESPSKIRWIALLGVPYIYSGYQILKRRIPKGFNIFLEEF